MCHSLSLVLVGRRGWQMKDRYDWCWKMGVALTPQDLVLQIVDSALNLVMYSSVWTLDKESPRLLLTLQMDPFILFRSCYYFVFHHYLAEKELIHEGRQSLCLRFTTFPGIIQAVMKIRLLLSLNSLDFRDAQHFWLNFKSILWLPRLVPLTLTANINCILKLLIGEGASNEKAQLVVFDIEPWRREFMMEEEFYTYKFSSNSLANTQFIRG